VNAFVLAGGVSSRMGRDKALLEIDGRPLIVHALEKLRALGLAPRICGARPALALFAETIPDNIPHCGPLGGIEAALSITDADLNLFLPVDLPLLPVEFLRWLAHRAQSTGAVATIPQLDTRPQPLCAVYSRRLRPGLRAALTVGDYKVMVAIPAAATALAEPIDLFDVEPIAPEIPSAPSAFGLPPLDDWFRNVNTPADLEFLRATLASQATGQNPAFQ
jgi:molybdenum cofactor guanylyltransferase